MKTIYCLWNDHTNTVTLKQGDWDAIKHISRTGVKKFKSSQLKLAKAFARTKQDMFNRHNLAAKAAE
jgi:hypothetical protein